MNELKVLEILKNELGFSYNSIKKLKIFHNYLLDYNKRYNLISSSTEKSIWLRHILDSAQIIRFISDFKNLKIADFGTGAGFPGLIIGLYNENVRFHVKLYEKSPVKRAFLKNIKEKLDINSFSLSPKYS